MGVNNRQRRKAKKQKQQQQQRSTYRPADAWLPPRQRRVGDEWGGDLPPRPPPSEAGPADPAAAAEAGVLSAAQAFHWDPDVEYRRMLGALSRIEERTRPGVVHGATTRCLERSLEMAWTNGWQPADVVRLVRRRLGSNHAGAVAHLVGASGGARREAATDDRWAAQAAAIADDAPAATAFDPGTPDLELAIEAISVLQRVPVLPKLASTSRRPHGGPSSVAMLARVRALLAKAESTTFPQEAESLTAKAQELMARHAIDAAMLDAANHAAGPSAVVGWRIGVDDPYASAKSMLLGGIARANRCRTVWSKSLGFSTVFGDRADLEMVELLFTSLLVQGTDAMLRAGRSTDRHGTSRTRSFRQSFLVAYATRIGERLATAVESAVAEGAERHGDALLPVLTSRAEEVRRVVEETFPHLVRRDTSVTNHAGWLAGRAAADLASLGVSEELATG